MRYFLKIKQSQGAEGKRDLGRKRTGRGRGICSGIGEGVGLKPEGPAERIETGNLGRWRCQGPGVTGSPLEGTRDLGGERFSRLKRRDLAETYCSGERELTESTSSRRASRVGMVLPSLSQKL